MDEPRFTITDKDGNIHEGQLDMLEALGLDVSQAEEIVDKEAIKAARLGVLLDELTSGRVNDLRELGKIVNERVPMKRPKPR